MPVRTIPINDFSGGLNVRDKADMLHSSRTGLAFTPAAKDVLSIGKALYQRLGFARWLDTGNYDGRVVFMDDDWRGYGPVVFLVNDTVTTNVDQDQFSPSVPPVPWTPRQMPLRNANTFAILTPANETLNVLTDAELTISWRPYRGALGYRVIVKDFDTGVEAVYYPDCPTPQYTVPADRFSRSKTYLVKVWAITQKNEKGLPLEVVGATNTRTFTTRLTAPVTLAPVGTLTTLTPTLTCAAVAKAVRYKVKIYEASGVTVLHESMALMVPSYVLPGGVLENGTTYQWTYTAYPDTACTEAYGVESAQAEIQTAALSETYNYSAAFKYWEAPEVPPSGTPFYDGTLNATMTKSGSNYTDAVNGITFTAISGGWGVWDAFTSMQVGTLTGVTPDTAAFASLGIVESVPSPGKYCQMLSFSASEP
jgi:hypothetical protein